ncbi:hypothetical protein X747_12440 [Mesorhizobium sp. LNJC384A00]|nr:hypothetical protein X747_12440 [Mesorhizobium sp. LNJC384A00]
MFNRFQRWVISIRDFGIARSAAIFLAEEFDENISYKLPELRKFRCYETTLVVSYARPFAKAEGVVGSLSLKDIGLKSTDEFWPLHVRVLELRNKLFGHSDAEHVPFRVLYSLLDKARPDAPIILTRFSDELTLTTSEIQALEARMSTFIHLLRKKGYEAAKVFPERLTQISGELDAE